MKIPNGTPPQITFGVFPDMKQYKKNKPVLKGQETAQRKLNYRGEEHGRKRNI